ncbi:hypothetical protein J6590_031440 [Homalodisca vitripennis]|nr:hypothetical protein J6590_031440 [Homalodisca vitripennis]
MSPNRRTYDCVSKHINSDVRSSQPLGDTPSHSYRSFDVAGCETRPPFKPYSECPQGPLAYEKTLSHKIGGRFHTDLKLRISNSDPTSLKHYRTHSIIHKSDDKLIIGGIFSPLSRTDQNNSHSSHTLVRTELGNTAKVCTHKQLAHLALPRCCNPSK